MADVAAASYVMGTDDGLDLEKPAHKVTVGHFCIDRREVTTADYHACSERGECTRAGRANAWRGISARDHEVYDPLCNERAVDDRGNHPANCVTWEDASRYCTANGKRLPTEAEWELAARGPEGRRYPWGEEQPGADRINACGAECLAWEKKNRVDQDGAMYEGDDGWVHTAPVGSFPKGASPYGVEDLVGNVWEWVADWHAPYAAEEAVDPAGPTKGDKRVMRGGAWNGAYASWVRPTFRFGADPAMRSHGVGFRCAKTL
jgi:formylglycine-generating enzyme required for sulfatase activity